MSKALLLCIAGILIHVTSSVSYATDTMENDRDATVVFTNAYIYTVAPDRRIAEAIAIKGNHIVAVGSLADVQPYIGPTTHVEDLDGKMVLPGLHDTHIHALGTVEPDMCDLKSVPYSLSKMVPTLKKCLDTYNIAKGDWLIVAQWNFSDGNQPGETYHSLRQALDAVSLDNPIILLGNDGHHGAVNSLALEGAKTPEGALTPITAETLKGIYAPFKEMIAVDKGGVPSGGINEGARALVRQTTFLDTIGADRKAEELMPQVARVLASRGITSIQDPAVVPQSIAMYKKLEDMGEMTFRMRAGFMITPEKSHTAEGLTYIPEYVEALKTLRSEYATSELIKADGVKLFADAVLEGNPYATPPTLPVAAVLNGIHQPHFSKNNETHKLEILGYIQPDGPECLSASTQSAETFLAEYGFSALQCTESAGVLEHSEAFIKEYVAAMTKAGFNVHIHALSDKGVRVAVEAFEAVKKLADKNSLTQSLAHLQLVHPDDQRKIGKLGIYNSFTYVWAEPVEEYDLTVIPFIDEVQNRADMYNPEHYYMQNVYPAKSIQTYGGVLVAGSDAPVGSRDPMPFTNMEKAVTRANEGRVYNAQERLSIEEVIAAYTINGAAMLGQRDKVGSLEAGKLADLIVLDRNIIEQAETGNAEKISDTHVLLTVFNGKIVYRAGAQEP